MARSTSGNYQNPRDYNIADPLAFSKSFESTFESTFKEGMNYYNNKIEALQNRDERLKNTANEMAKLGEAAIKSGKLTREYVETSINNFFKENKKFKYNKKGERVDFVNYTKANSGESINNFNAEIGGINDFLGFAFSEEGLNFDKTANISDPEHAQLSTLIDEQIENQNVLSFDFNKDGFKGGASYTDPITGEKVDLSSSDLTRIISSTTGSQERRKFIEKSFEELIDISEDFINKDIQNLLKTSKSENKTTYIDADEAGGIIDQQVESIVGRQPIEDLQNYYNNNSNLTTTQKIKMFEDSQNPIISKLVSRDNKGNLTEKSAENLETLGGLRFLPTDNDRAVKFLKRITGEDISAEQAKAIASEIDLKRLAVTKSIFKQNILDRGILDEFNIRKEKNTGSGSGVSQEQKDIYLKRIEDYPMEISIEDISIIGEKGYDEKFERIEQLVTGMTRDVPGKGVTIKPVEGGGVQFLLGGSKFKTIPINTATSEDIKKIIYTVYGGDPKKIEGILGETLPEVPSLFNELPGPKRN